MLQGFTIITMQGGIFCLHELSNCSTLQHSIKFSNCCCQATTQEQKSRRVWMAEEKYYYKLIAWRNSKRLQAGMYKGGVPPLTDAQRNLCSATVHDTPEFATMRCEVQRDEHGPIKDSWTMPNLSSFCNQNKSQNWIIKWGEVQLKSTEWKEGSKRTLRESLSFKEQNFASTTNLGFDFLHRCLTFPLLHLLSPGQFLRWPGIELCRESRGSVGEHIQN